MEECIGTTRTATRSVPSFFASQREAGGCESYQPLKVQGLGVRVQD